MFARCAVLLVTIVLLSAPALAAAPPAKVTTVEGITEYRLANGLTRAAGP